MTHDSKSSASVLSDIIRQRQTWKVLGNPDDPVIFSSEILDSCNAKVHNAVDHAGWAPFHYDRSVNEIAEPWRVHLLWADTCRTIAKEFSNWFDDIKPTNKLPPMLAACGSVALVTWLPQFRGGEAGEEALTLEKKIQIDDEHLLATGAMIQNLLLLLTAQGLGTYWSSGGQLGSSTMFKKLGIDCNERLAAAVFIEYPDGNGPVKERVSGKNRGRRSPATQWAIERAISQ